MFIFFHWAIIFLLHLLILFILIISSLGLYLMVSNISHRVLSYGHIVLQHQRVFLLHMLLLWFFLYLHLLIVLLILLLGSPFSLFTIIGHYLFKLLPFTRIVCIQILFTSEDWSLVEFKLIFIMI